MASFGKKLRGASLAVMVFALSGCGTITSFLGGGHDPVTQDPFAVTTVPPLALITSVPLAPPAGAVASAQSGFVNQTALQQQAAAAIAATTPTQVNNNKAASLAAAKAAREKAQLKAEIATQLQALADAAADKQQALADAADAAALHEKQALADAATAAALHEQQALAKAAAAATQAQNDQRHAQKAISRRNTNWGIAGVIAMGILLAAREMMHRRKIKTAVAIAVAQQARVTPVVPPLPPTMINENANPSVTAFSALELGAVQQIHEDISVSSGTYISRYIDGTTAKDGIEITIKKGAEATEDTKAFAIKPSCVEILAPDNEAALKASIGAMVRVKGSHFALETQDKRLAEQIKIVIQAILDAVDDEKLVDPSGKHVTEVTFNGETLTKSVPPTPAPAVPVFGKLVPA